MSSRSAFDKVRRPEFHRLDTLLDRAPFDQENDLNVGSELPHRAQRVNARHLEVEDDGVELAIAQFQTVDDLWFLNRLTLAFTAGSELRLSRVREKLKSMLLFLAGSMLLTFLGVTLTVLAAPPFVPFMKRYSIGVSG